VLLVLLSAGLALSAGEPKPVTIHFFWAPNCPHCAEARPFLADLHFRYPLVRVKEYEIWGNRENFELLQQLAQRAGGGALSTPAIAVGDRLWFGFSPALGEEIEAAVERCLAVGCRDPLLPQEDADVSPPAPAVEAPLFGRVDPEHLSLPLFTVLLGLLDSFNPCAFFVLLFLLSLMVHARSRRTMLLVGGTFVLCSGLLYFLFMAAWLNLFLLAGRLPAVTTAAGAVALLVAGFNIKDFFLFHRGPSLSIPEQARPRLFERMRRLLQESRTAAVLLGTVVLAVAANSYELLCTAGFPMVYTRVLTLRQLPSWQYYAFLGLYNLVYVLPLLGIVLGFTLTLGSRKLSEWQGRVLKLVSGLMMLLLGLLLLVDPALLDNPLAALGAVVVALAAAGLIAWLCRARRHPE
jgi:thiol-disulfide isomerase/thioredoxin